jgi:hypothetical protein
MKRCGRAESLVGGAEVIPEAWETRAALMLHARSAAAGRAHAVAALRFAGPATYSRLLHAYGELVGTFSAPPALIKHSKLFVDLMDIKHFKMIQIFLTQCESDFLSVDVYFLLS